MKIPAPYNVFIEKFKEKVPHSNEIPIQEIRYILQTSFKFHRSVLNDILLEMKKLGLIEFSKCRFVIIKV